MTVLSLSILSLLFIGLFFLLLLISCLGWFAALLSGFALTGHLVILVAILLGSLVGGPFLFCLTRLLYNLLLLLRRFRVLRTGVVGSNGRLGGLCWRRSRS